MPVLFGSSDMIAFNVQTTSHYNNRVCAIGIARIRKGKITSAGQLLVNPEEPIESSLTIIHGINDYMVEDAPLLPQRWEILADHFHKAIIVGHNVKFHLAAFGKALDKYGLHPQPVRYIDTLSLARKIYPSAAFYGLRSICQYNQIPYKEDAESKALAVGNLFLKMRGKRVIVPQRWDFVKNLNYDTFIRNKW